MEAAVSHTGELMSQSVCRIHIADVNQLVGIVFSSQPLDGLHLLPLPVAIHLRQGLLIDLVALSRCNLSK